MDDYEKYIKSVRRCRIHKISFVVVLVLILMAFIDMKNHSGLIDAGVYKVNVDKVSSTISLSEFNKEGNILVHIKDINLVDSSSIEVKVRETDFRSIYVGDKYLGRAETRLSIPKREEYRSIYIWISIALFVIWIWVGWYIDSKDFGRPTIVE